MDAPNVLLVVLDATRKDHLSCYGYDRPTTPALDDLASEGVRFEQAISAAPWTPPSHASMFTGCYPSRHRVYGSQLELTSDGPTVAELLSEAGYDTFGFSNSYHTSIERNFDRGFDYYHDILALPRFMDTMYEPSLDFLRFLPNYFLDGYDISDFQLRKLETQIERGDDPFFGFINFNSAHAPYMPPGEFREEFEAYFDGWDDLDEAAARQVGEEDGYEFVFGELSLSETEWDLVKCWYDAEIRYMDHLLSGFFDFLKAQGAYEDTLVIVTADHGEHFGEHGLVYHQFSLFEELLNVPLVVKFPSTGHGTDPAPPSGDVSDRLVSLVDLAPTIYEWTGVEDVPAMDGLSLTGEDEHDAVFAEYDRPFPPLRDRLQSYDAFDRYDQGLQAIRTTEFKLIRTSRGAETLYRLEDGHESVADDPEAKAALSERLDEAVDEVPDANYDEEIPDHVADHLSEMGYM